MTTPKTTPGEAAYNAYRASIIQHRGNPDEGPPEWGPSIHGSIKIAWEVAASAAIKHVLGSRLADWSSARAEDMTRTTLTSEPPPNTPNGRRVGVSR